jgi:membrane associated rhomboid family serine protease
MFPFRDNIPSRTVPYVTVGLIVLNVLAFTFELSLGSALDRFIWQYGIVPARVASWHRAPSPLIQVAAPFLTSMFLHGGFLHLIGNMWYLWIFGDNVEDRLGHGRYAVFYLACGVVAGAVHTALNIGSLIPTLGASGAVAGVLGAYAVSYPSARISTLVPIFIFIQIIELPALVVLGLWFVMQFFGAIGPGSGGIAWGAHIGGFLAGIVLLYAMLGRRRNRGFQS